MGYLERPPHLRAGLMTPVVLFGALLSGVGGTHLAEFGVAFGGGMLLHGFSRSWFSWLHFAPAGGSLTRHLAFAFARGLAIMALCYAGCAVASTIATIVHVPVLALWLQGVWAGILVDSMLVVQDDDGQRRHRRAATTAKIRELVESVARIHGTPAPVPT